MSDRETLMELADEYLDDAISARAWEAARAEHGAALDEAVAEAQSYALPLLDWKNQQYLTS